MAGVDAVEVTDVDVDIDNDLIRLCNTRLVYRDTHESGLYRVSTRQVEYRIV